MLTRMDIVNGHGDVLALTLSDASAGYLVREIDGLDPVKATLVSSTIAQVDGAQYQTASRDPRNITGKIALKPDLVVDGTTAAALRSNLYKYAMPKSIVLLKFYVDGTLFAETAAVVESLSNSMFTNDPEVDFSFMCYDPDFYSPSSVTFDGFTTSGSTPQLVAYDGTTEAGILFTINFDQSVSALTIHNTQPDGTPQAFEVEGTFVSGDSLVVSTVPGSKAVTFTHSGVPSSLLFGVISPPDWIALANGDNEFRVFISGGTPIAFTVEYVPKYGGL